MKKRFIPYCLVLFVLLCLSTGLKSQKLPVNTAGERIEVCTDRTIYVAGEKLFFSALIFDTTDSGIDHFSRVLYCELITPDGKKVDGRKYLLQKASVQGCFIIPDETISGIYYLKFYTRFMRNIGPAEYKFVMLKIINPFKTEVLPGKDALDTAGMKGSKLKLPETDQFLKIISSKKIFSPREEIRLIMNCNKAIGNSPRFCLSVIPEFTFNNGNVQPEHSLDTAKKVMYLPETRGVSLSGQLIGKENRKPVPFAKVNLSIIGDKDIQVVLTDSSGRFFFALPDYNGNRDIFLCADDIPEIKPEILIDNDFCSRPVNLPSPIFTLNEDEMKAGYSLAVNSRITSIFRREITAADTGVEINNTSFYGKPTEVLFMEKFIDLPKLEEYFTQIPALAKLRKVQGRKQFRFYATQAEMSMYDPLLLVDWVAVNDIDKILAMSPPEIERIELVNAPYIKGCVTYGGILTFVSKKNNFAGIDLPSSGTFVNYRFLEASTDNVPSPSSGDNIPDSRNTVYWNPDVQTNDAGAADITFKAPDTPGKYYILLREMNITGEVVLSSEMIVVEKK